MKAKLIITILLLAAFTMAKAQSEKPLKANWQNLDLQTDSVFGISTEKAYTELLKGKKHVPVIVAVIDVGVDITHEDLKSIIWTNPKEIPGNGIDDDHNGYADDVHGWNFLGGPGGDIEYETNEIVRLVRKEMPLYKNADSTKFKAERMQKFRAYKKMKFAIDSIITDDSNYIISVNRRYLFTDTLLADMHNQNPSNADLKAFTPKAGRETRFVTFLQKNYFGNDFRSYVTALKDTELMYVKQELNYNYNYDYNPRYMVGDDPDNVNEHFYGNNHISAPDDEHGTFVSGIIGALRDNNIGIKGVANDVIIMPVRAIPQGDERDKDVANAIRYAVNNGAKIINMSFSKLYSPDKKVVDEAVKYAVSKDVLLVRGAGNDNHETDIQTTFPNRSYADGSGSALSWLTVGASGPVNDSTLKVSFSNWGKTTVDLFAPGTDIKSCIVGSKYDVQSGTSYSSPMVAGLAALIRSYYPKLTAVQVKEVILKSVTKIDHDVTITGDTPKKLPFSALCVSGGIANAYNALKLAATY